MEQEPCHIYYYHRLWQGQKQEKIEGAYQIFRPRYNSRPSHGG